jgi:hypothetical protein
MKWFGAALGLGCWLCVSVAGAEPRSVFHLDYQAHDGCPDAATFRARVESHAPLVRLARAEEKARRFSVAFAVESEAARGRLVILGLDGMTSVREVEGRNCSEVADALALVLAIILYPNVGADPGAGSKPKPSGARVLARAPNKDRDWGRLRAGLAFQAGVVGLRLAPELGTALLFGAEIVLDRASLFAPSLRLSGYRIQSGEVITAYGRAQFEWTAARLSGCPLRWPSGTVGLRPCAIADVGQLRAEGYDAPAADRHTLAWAALGAALRLDALVLNILLLEIEAGGLAPLSEDSFFFDPGDRTAYTVGPGVYAMSGIGVRFP